MMTAAKRTCHKRRYATEHDAGKSLTRAQARASRGVMSRVPTRYYECPICGGFHTTSRVRIA